MFVNPPGVANFRALRVESGDQHLYWQPTYQHILRVEGAFGEFFPQAEFSDNGNQVIFSKYVDNTEVLALTRALSPGERIPRAEWQRFLATWTNFKRLADRTDIPEDVRNFIYKFGPPSVERYPAAYRIYRPSWYSKSRLFILWGLEPVGGADFVAVSPEEAISEGTARAETDGEATSSDLLRWLKIFFFGLLAIAALLFLLWCCLPRPVVDFEVSAVAQEPATTKNLTTLDRSLDWGSTEYHWNFVQALPDASTEFEPKPVWLRPGPYEVTLQATQKTLWGLLYKTDAKTLTVTVVEQPKPIVATPAIPGLTVPAFPPKVIPAPKGETGKGVDPTSSEGKMTPDGKIVPNVPMPGELKSDGEGKGKAPPGSESPYGKLTPDGKMAPGVSKPDVPKVEGEADRDPEQVGPSGKMTADGKMTPLVPKAEGKDVPEMVRPGGKIGPDGKMIPGTPKPGEPKSDGKAAPNVVGPGGKMTPDEKMLPGAPKSGEAKPEGEATPTPGAVRPDGKMGPDGKVYPDGPKNPSPSPRSPVPRSQLIPVPQVVIVDVTPLADGKSQDIDFSLNLPKGVQLEHLEVDGKEVKVPPNGAFRLRLPIGPHSLHIEYGSTSSDLHGEVTQDLMVDADQVKVIKPKTRIAPPVKVPGSDQPMPAVPTKPRDEAAEKFDKKTA